jgi:1-aminocyclopropane-1-carboxylate deaminase/D-cysteine desulfhydrase-like pyridoxal-dependent ACC family enzyme
VKREDLASPRYGGNKLRTLQHQLAAVEAHKDVSPGAVFSMIGSTGSNMVVATKVHGAATFGMAQEELQSLSFLPDKPDLDNTLNLLSTLSLGGSVVLTPVVGFRKLIGAVRSSVDKVFPPGGHNIVGVLGQMGAPPPPAPARGCTAVLRCNPVPRGR